jgi:hypothetical protein
VRLDVLVVVERLAALEWAATATHSDAPPAARTPCLRRHCTRVSGDEFLTRFAKRFLVTDRAAHRPRSWDRVGTVTSATVKAGTVTGVVVTGGRSRSA